jgi:phosphonate transport system substrate-binding protein
MALCVASLIITACGRRGRGIRVDPNKLMEEEQAVGNPSAPPVRIALGSVLTPKVGFAYYRQLLDYVGVRLERDVECIEKKSYAEVNLLLEAGEVDMAFVCSKPYVDGAEAFGLELLVAPQVRGETAYYSYIVVPRDSETKVVAGLRGGTFAFTDPMSNTGRLAPLHMLKKLGETPDSFFESSIYTYAHDKSIRLVSQHVVNGAAVDSLVWEYANEQDPEDTARTRIIEKLGPFGIPPVVVRPGLDVDLKQKLREILLNVHRDEAGAAILGGMMIECFVPIEDKHYDSIRMMEAVIAKETVDNGE